MTTKTPDPLPPLTGNPTPDVARAWAVLDLIDQHRASLAMSAWTARLTDDEEVLDDPDGPVDLAVLTAECGTVACHAGWTVASAGYTMIVVNGVTIAKELAEQAYGSALDDVSYFELDNRFSVSVVAQRLLGLTDDDARDLFLYTDESNLTARTIELFGPRPGVTA